MNEGEIECLSALDMQPNMEASKAKGGLTTLFIFMIDLV